MKYWLMPLMSPCGTFITYKKMYYQPLVESNFINP